MTNTELEDVFGPVLHRYTRQQAIEDGVLVDLSSTTDSWMPAMIREAGITIPVAMTAAAFVDCVSPMDGEGLELAPGQDIKGRLWDVLWMFTCAVRSGGRDKSEILFRLRVVPNIPAGSHRYPRAKLVTLKAVIGGDDHGAPCITIMYPHED
jgi:hypothetical protein